MDSLNEKKILPFMKHVVLICQKVTDKKPLSKKEDQEFKILSSLIDGFFRLTNCSIDSIDELLGKEIKTTYNSIHTGNNMKPSVPHVHSGPAPAPKPKHPEYDSNTDVEFSDSDSDIDDTSEQRKKETEKNYELINLGHKRVKIAMNGMKFRINHNIYSDGDSDSDSEKDSTSCDSSDIPDLVPINATNDDTENYQLTPYVPPPITSCSS
jgi:hypothetical protein